MMDRPGGIDGLKNRSGKCEGPGGGLDELKNRSGNCEGPGKGVDRVKNRSGKCKGPGRGGGTNGCLKRKVFLKNQKHQPNIVEITHLCIMHRVHTSYLIYLHQQAICMKCVRYFPRPLMRVPESFNPESHHFIPLFNKVCYTQWPCH